MNLNATFIVQVFVFFTLAWFVSRFVWPPVRIALDERRDKIASGLKAAELAQANLAEVEKQVKVELAQAKLDNKILVVDAEKQAINIIAEAKAAAEVECSRMLQAAKIEVEQQMFLAKQSLREQVASLTISGAEQILKREVNASTHVDLLTALKTKL